MDFVIPSEKRDILLNSSNRICTLFDVQVLVQSEASNQQWVKLVCSRQGRKEALQQAKDYITALCCPEMTEIIPNSTRSSTNIDSIARNYGVVATVDKENIFLEGKHMNVALAKSWIENEGTSPKEASTESMSSCKSFARKLGYSESDIDLVAKALGPGPVDKNTFLQELINRGQRTERKGKRDIVARGIAARSMPSSDATERTVQQRQIIEVPRHIDDQVQADGGSHSDLCPVIIDGSNVAMDHGNHKYFSPRGIAICVEHFQRRGHKEVFALVPRYRADPPIPGTNQRPGNVVPTDRVSENQRPETPVEDQRLLLDMAERGVVIFTPSKRDEDGRNIICYDDRFIIDLAHKLDGVIVSNDGYRDLVYENKAWKNIIDKRVLKFVFVRDIFMVPDDPLGRRGPSLTQFLRKGVTIEHPRICPWLGCCTFGPKCQYYHPDRERRKAEKSRQSDSMKRNVSGLQNKQHGDQQHDQQQQQQQQYSQEQQHSQQGNIYEQQQQYSQRYSQQGNQHEQQQQQYSQRYSQQGNQHEQQQQYSQRGYSQQGNQHEQQHRNQLYPQHQFVEQDYYHAQRPLPPYQHQPYPEYEAGPYQQQTTMYTVPTQYSYTPPNSSGYNNSSSIDKNKQTLLDKLIEMFPGESERITRLLEENPEIQDISKLADLLLQDS